MIIEKNSQGAYNLSQLTGGVRFHRQYFHPKKEAIKLFREDLILNFLKDAKGWQSIAHTERKAAERLELKGKIFILKHKNSTWQIFLR
jgi:hypothetical protein